jgi:O-acetylhomoserine/O-acetylserine sulfhydrylase-like pyridoxal-dependent enzyme
LGAKQRITGHGHGGLLSFTLPGTKMFAWRVMENLKLIAISTNIGDTKSLVTHPASTTHGRLSSKDRELASITDNLLRISVGLEDEKDLLDDLLNAIDTTASETDSRTSGDSVPPRDVGSPADVLEQNREHHVE